MEAYVKHFLRPVDRVLAADIEPLLAMHEALRAMAPKEPMPGTPDYSGLSKGVATFNSIDKARETTEAWEAAHPLPGVPA